MNRITTLLLTAAFSLLRILAAQAANIPISSLPFTITAPGTYVLAQDLSYSAQQGVAINILTNLAGPVIVNDLR